MDLGTLSHLGIHRARQALTLALLAIVLTLAMFLLVVDLAGPAADPIVAAPVRW